MYLNMVSEKVDKDQLKSSSCKDKDNTFYDSSILFGNRRQIAINHNGTIYLLKVTRFGKLILNK